MHFCQKSRNTAHICHKLTFGVVATVAAICYRLLIFRGEDSAKVKSL